MLGGVSVCSGGEGGGEGIGARVRIFEIRQGALYICQF
jgi:hypothetical protein